MGGGRSILSVWAAAVYVIVLRRWQQEKERHWNVYIK